MIRTSKSSLSLPHSFVRGEKGSFCLLGPLRGCTLVLAPAHGITAMHHFPSPYGVHCAECQEQCISFCGLTLPSPYGVYPRRAWIEMKENGLFFRPLTGCTCKNIQKAAAKLPVNQTFSTGMFSLYHNLNQKGIPQSK